MASYKVDYIKEAAMNRLKDSNVFSEEHYLEINAGISLVSVFFNLTEKVPEQDYHWLVSIPLYNTCFFLPTYTTNLEDIEEHLHNAKNGEKAWNKELAKSIYRKIDQILNEA